MRDAAQDHVRLEEQAALDRDRPPAAQAREVRLQPLRQHDVHGRFRVGGQPADVGEDRVAERSLERRVVDRDAEVIVRPVALAEVHGAEVVGADPAGVLDRAQRRLVGLRLRGRGRRAARARAPPGVAPT